MIVNYCDSYISKDASIVYLRIYQRGRLCPIVYNWVYHIYCITVTSEEIYDMIGANIFTHIAYICFVGIHFDHITARYQMTLPYHTIDPKRVI